jgi:hypothetical protein
MLKAYKIPHSRTMGDAEEQTQAMDTIDLDTIDADSKADNKADNKVYSNSNIDVSSIIDSEAK